jgi:hypothetical protein
LIGFGQTSLSSAHLVSSRRKQKKAEESKRGQKNGTCSINKIKLRKIKGTKGVERSEKVMARKGSRLRILLLKASKALLCLSFFCPFSSFIISKG